MQSSVQAVQCIECPCILPGEREEMAEYENEKREQYHPVPLGFLKSVYHPHDVCRYVKRTSCCCIAVISMIFSLLMVAVIVLSVRRPEPLPEYPIFLVDSCPKDWIGFQRRCYYFAEIERNWTSSQMECSSFNASLAVIDSQEEMGFIRRYKGPADHWIGLQRNLETEPWKWINGTMFNNWFEVHGGGECGYMNHLHIASSSCTREERWICSKQTESWLRTSNAFQYEMDHFQRLQ